MIKNIDYDDYWKIWTEFYVNNIFNKLSSRPKIQDVNPESLKYYYYSNESQVQN